MYRAAFALFVFLILLAAEGNGQEAVQDGPSEEVLPVGLPVRLDISRRPLSNFLTDGTALLPYRKPDDSVSDFPGAFTIGSPQARFAVIWAPTSCRIVGVVDLRSELAEATYRILASGIAPTTTIAGSSSGPVFFGMRLEEGRPEFLYTHGGHAIAESIWLEDEGTILKQRYTLRKGVTSLRLTVPPEWVSLVQPSAGEWNENVLEVKGESVTEVTLLYRLNTSPEDSIPEETE